MYEKVLMLFEGTIAC